MSSSDNQTAFTGHIASTLDALLIFEACRRGNLTRAQSRLTEAERRNIKSGDVYVFGEEESKIKRWTDGRRWSPSRIMNNFLVYRELEPSEKELKKAISVIPAHNDTDNHDASSQLPASSSTQQMKREESQNRSFGGDMFDDPPTIAAAKEKVSQIPVPGIVLQGGLVKKTISVGGLHMISYYVPADIKNGSLKTPSSVPELASLEINHIFLLARYFRHPPQVSFGEDGMPRFVAITDDDPMPRKASTGTSTSTSQQPKKVKQEPTTVKQEEGRPRSEAGSASIAGPPSFFPKMEPQDDIFPEEFGTSGSPFSHMPSPPPPFPTNRRSSTGYSSGSRYRSVPGMTRSLSSASDTTTAADIAEHPPSMRPRTGSSSGGTHRHEPYRVPLNRGPSSSTTISSSSTYYHPPYTANMKSPRHSISTEYSPNMMHLRQSQRNDVMYTEGIGRHLRSASLSSGLGGGGASRRGSMTSSPSIHAQLSAANANATSPQPMQEHRSPYFESQHPGMSYSPYMAAQRPYTSPDGSIPEQQTMHEGYMADVSSAQMYAYPSQVQMEQQYPINEEASRRMSTGYFPTIQAAQPPWSVYQGSEPPYPLSQQEQYYYPSSHLTESSTNFGLPGAPSHAYPLQQSETIFVSGQQPYPMGEFVQPHSTSGEVFSEGGQQHIARNAVFQYYPPSSSSTTSQHAIPLPRTEFSPLMPASASYPSSLSSLDPQLHQQNAEDGNMSYHQVTEDQQHAGLGLYHQPAPPSYSHQHQPRETYPAHLGKAKIDYKVVELVAWPTDTSPKAAQHQHQQYHSNVHPSELAHPEYPDMS